MPPGRCSTTQPMRSSSRAVRPRTQPRAQASAVSRPPSATQLRLIPNAVGDESCSLDDLGSVCVIDESTGYDAAYFNHTNSSQLVDFNLVTASGRHIGDQGAFTAAPIRGGTPTFFATGHVAGQFRHRSEQQASAVRRGQPADPAQLLVIVGVYVAGRESLTVFEGSQDAPSVLQSLLAQLVEDWHADSVCPIRYVRHNSDPTNRRTRRRTVFASCSCAWIGGRDRGRNRVGRTSGSRSAGGAASVDGAGRASRAIA